MKAHTVCLVGVREVGTKQAQPGVQNCNIMMQLLWLFVQVPHAVGTHTHYHSPIPNGFDSRMSKKCTCPCASNRNEYSMARWLPIGCSYTAV